VPITLKGNKFDVLVSQCFSSIEGQSFTVDGNTFRACSTLAAALEAEMPKKKRSKAAGKAAAANKLAKKRGEKPKKAHGGKGAR